MSEHQKTDKPYSQTHLPCTLKEVKKLGWEEIDIILFTGDAYVDHPSFGIAVIGRYLTHHGYKVAVVPQPNTKDDLRDFKKLGKPRLFFGVSSGNMDSIVNHYTGNGRLRSEDAYSPGGKTGFRPDYAINIYGSILKSIYPDTPLIIGGIEASGRRFTHYDFLSKTLMESVVISSKADLAVYGQGEKAILEVAKYIDVKNQIPKNIPQTIYTEKQEPQTGTTLFSHEQCLKSKDKFAENYLLTEKFIIEKKSTGVLYQKTKDKFVCMNKPYPASVLQKEIDNYYDLSYSYTPHPKYRKKEAIPAYEMIKNSINIHRGCFGGCSFCAIVLHQGKDVISRSKESIIKEATKISNRDDFKGHLTDLGGPSANMYKLKGKTMDICDKCKRTSCLYPDICKNLDTNHSELINLYKTIGKIPNIKKISIGSGVRYDLAFADSLEYLKLLISKHVSGRFKVAPEHTESNVLHLMNKPNFGSFYKLTKLFKEVNAKHGLKQQLIPYFISAHPGCTEIDMAELAVKTMALKVNTNQIQDFTPTPGTLATVMYYTEKNPYTGEKVYVAKTEKSRKNQRSFFFRYNKEDRFKIKQILNNLKRQDLIKKLKL